MNNNIMNEAVLVQQRQQQMDHRESLMSGMKRTERSAKSRNLTSDSKRRSSQDSSAGAGAGQGNCTTTEWLESFECDGSSICGYVKKVYKMMIESNNHSDIVTWDDQGEVIIIKDKTRFEELILPKFFDSNRYQSFKRQLYNYGFNKKSPDGNNHILFTNPHFHRDKPELLHKIQRNNTNLKKQTENAKQLKNMNGTDIQGGIKGVAGVGGISTAHFSSEVSELKQRVQLLEHENTLLHQTLCAITERLNRMEHIQLETMAPQLSSQQQQQVAAAAHVPSYPMPLPVRPSALSASMATSIDPVSSRASQVPPQAPPGTQAQAAAAAERILPPLDSQPPTFTSAFSMTNMNAAYCSEENVDENILEREDSFFSKSNVAEPKRYCDYTTEELKACTDSFRHMIEMMEQKKYSSRVLIVNGDDDDVHELEERMNLEYDRHCDLLQKSHGNLNSIPLRGQSVTLATSDDELNVKGVGGRGVPVGHDHQLLKSFTQTLNESHDLSGPSHNLNGSSATLPVYNGSNEHYRGGHHEEYDDEDVPADNTTSSNDDEEDSTNVTLTKLRKCEISV